MNRAQRAILKISLLVIALMLIFPPYEFGGYGRYPRGHHPIWNDVPYAYISLTGLLIEFVLLYSVVGIVVLLTKSVDDALFARFAAKLPSWISSLL